MAAHPYGLIATFETTPDLYHAAEQVRDAGYRNWDCITPFPVHGLDKAMGLKRSIVPRISLAGGITGFITGIAPNAGDGDVTVTVTDGQGCTSQASTASIDVPVPVTATFEIKHGRRTLREEWHYRTLTAFRQCNELTVRLLRMPDGSSWRANWARQE